MMPFGLLPHHTDASATTSRRSACSGRSPLPDQRNGYAAEAGAALVDFGFTQWQVRRIVATTEYANTASVGVMRRIGMRVDRNPLPAPFFLQVVGIIDNTGGEPDWPANPCAWNQSCGAPHHAVADVGRAEARLQARR